MTEADEPLKLKRVYLIPNAITAFGLCCGLFVIFKSILPAHTDNLVRLLQSIASLLLIAMIADAADGAVARIMKAESAFGELFDSLSDAVTFGVAPPLIILKSFEHYSLNRFFIFLLIVSSMIYTLCGVLRLVRYNLKKEKSSFPSLNETSKDCFMGLPIPAAASAIVSLSLYLVLFENSIPYELRITILSLSLLFIGGLMISPWTFPSFKTLYFRVPSSSLILVTGILAVLILYSFMDYFIEGFFIISWAYLVVIWPIFLSFHKKNKKNKL